jgi:hypothetical protein
VPHLPSRAATRPLIALAGATVLLLAWAGTSSAAAARFDAARASHSTTTTTAPPSSTSNTTVSQADTWLLRAIGAEAKVGSVKISASEAKGKSHQVISLLVNGDGEGSGTFVQGGSTIKIALVGTLLYFDAPKSYWKSHSTASQAAQFGGRWIEVSALDSRFAAFDEFFNPEDLVAAVFQGHATPLKLSKPKGTFAGHKYVIVSESVTTNGKKSSGQMYIATKGPARALKIIDKSPGMTTTITFTGYGKAVSIITPPEPINLT